MLVLVDRNYMGERERFLGVLFQYGPGDLIGVAKAKGYNPDPNSIVMVINVHAEDIYYPWHHTETWDMNSKAGVT